jgi:hypothetical protein
MEASAVLLIAERKPRRPKSIGFVCAQPLNEISGGRDVLD